jgi:opacity protein-like surface antigen
MKSFAGAVRLVSRASLIAASAAAAIAVGSTGASAQLTQPGCTSTFPPGDFFAAGYSQIIGGVVGASNAITSVIGTMNTSFIAQGNAFVAGLPNPTPDETSGGIWGRAIGGRVDNTSSGTFTGTINEFGVPVSGSINCNSDVRMNYGGFQLGQDIARLNIGGNGATLHVGVTGGYAEANAQDLGGSGFTGNFQIPFAGLYAAYTNGRFFADIMGRTDFYQMSLSAPDAALHDQRLNGLGYTLSGSAGYRFDVGNNWFVEPSGSLIFSKVNIDTLSLPGGFGNVQNPFFLPPATLAMNPVDSTLGRIGVRVGTTYNALNINWQPFATASIWHEFAGNTTANYVAPLFSIGGTLNPTPPAAGTLSNTRVGTYGQYSVGVAAQAVGSPLLGYLRLDVRDGSNIESLGFNAGLRYNFDPVTGPIKPVGIFKAPPPVVAAYNWTGFYAGAFTGAGFGNTDWSFPGLAVGANPRNAGVLGGGTVGYNQQYGAWVVGGEADLAGTNAKGGMACVPNIFDTGQLPIQNCNNDLGWVATATAKVGYAWDRVMVYGKAGGAWADTKLDASCNGDAFFPQGGCIPNTGVAGVQDAVATLHQFGWTVGAGFELALTPAWSAKAEYDYMNFGSSNVVLSDTTPVNFKQSFSEVKVGVNYHFGKDEVVVASAPMPVKAAPAAPAALYNWTGVYLGGAVADRLSTSTWNTLAINSFNFVGGGFIAPDPTTTPASFFNGVAQPRLYAGYNWQFSPKWVAGIEGDVGAPGGSMTRGGIPGTFGNGVNSCPPLIDITPTFNPCNFALGIGAPGTEAELHDSSTVKLGWDGTIRAKVGMLVTPTILFYGTGGAAFQQVEVSARCDGFFPGSWCTVPRGETFSSTRVGWTAGLGIEAVLFSNLIGKAEVRYADFGHFNNTFFAGTGDDVVTSVHVQTVTALAGVAYKFGPPGIVVAKY